MARMRMRLSASASRPVERPVRSSATRKERSTVTLTSPHCAAPAIGPIFQIMGVQGRRISAREGRPRGVDTGGFRGIVRPPRFRGRGRVPALEG